jgi:hypothetical protein
MACPPFRFAGIATAIPARMKRRAGLAPVLKNSNRRPPLRQEKVDCLAGQSGEEFSPAPERSLPRCGGGREGGQAVLFRLAPLFLPKLRDRRDPPPCPAPTRGAETLVALCRRPFTRLPWIVLPGATSLDRRAFAAGGNRPNHPFNRIPYHAVGRAPFSSPNEENFQAPGPRGSGIPRPADYLLDRRRVRNPASMQSPLTT